MAVLANSDVKQPIAVVVAHETNIHTFINNNKLNPSNQKDIHHLVKDPKVRSAVLAEINSTGKKAGLSQMELLMGVVLVADEWTVSRLGSSVSLIAWSLTLRLCGRAYVARVWSRDCRAEASAEGDREAVRGRHQEGLRNRLGPLSLPSSCSLLVLDFPSLLFLRSTTFPLFDASLLSHLLARYNHDHQLVSPLCRPLHRVDGTYSSAEHLSQLGGTVDTNERVEEGGRHLEEREADRLHVTTVARSA